MNRLSFVLLLSGWRRKPWLRLGIIIVFGLGFGLACLAGQLWISGQNWLTSRLGTRPPSDTVILAAPGQSQASFNQTELDDLSRQEFVLRVWPVTSNQFRSRTGIQLGTTRFATELFFDAVADDFLSPLPSGWTWSKDSLAESQDMAEQPIPTIPILIPRDFLNLYNYGFAPARQLPPLGPEALALVPLDISIDTPKGTIHLIGRIIGVNDQLSTILVPLAFMDWANHRFGKSASNAPKRVVVAVRNASDPAIARWSTSHGWTLASTDSGLREAFGFVMVLVAMFGILSVLILLLSTVVLVLDRSNQLQRDRDDILVLIIVGHQARHLAIWSLIPDLTGLLLSVLGFGIAAFMISLGIASVLGLYGLTMSASISLVWLAVGPVMACMVSWLQYLQFNRSACTCPIF